MPAPPGAIASVQILDNPTLVKEFNRRPRTESSPSGASPALHWSTISMLSQNEAVVVWVYEMLCGKAIRGRGIILENWFDVEK